MTVAELIEELKKCPLDSEVWLCCEGLEPVADIAESSRGVTIYG